MPELKIIIFSDEDIIKGINSGIKKLEDQCFKYIYKNYYNMVLNYILNNNGTEENAKDLFQYAVITFYEKNKKGEYNHNAKISTYLFEIAKKRWLNELSHKKITNEYEKKNPSLKHENSPEDEYVQNEKRKRVCSIIKKLKKDCRKILVYAIYNKYSMEEIAKLMNYKNSQVARNKKKLCLDALKNIIKKSNPLLQEMKEFYYSK